MIKLPDIELPRGDVLSFEMVDEFSQYWRITHKSETETVFYGHNNTVGGIIRILQACGVEDAWKTEYSLEGLE